MSFTLFHQPNTNSFSFYNSAFDDTDIDQFLTDSREVGGCHVIYCLTQCQAAKI